MQTMAEYDDGWGEPFLDEDDASLEPSNAGEEGRAEGPTAAARIGTLPGKDTDVQANLQALLDARTAIIEAKRAQLKRLVERLATTRTT